MPKPVLSESAGTLRPTLLTAFALALPTLLGRLTLPGIDTERFGELGLSDTNGMRLSAILLIPWLTGALLVACVAWLVPAWRVARRSEGTQRRLSVASRIVGALALLIQAFGLSLFFANEDFLIHERGAQWLVLISILGASSLVRWLAELVNRHGIGDGMSVVIAGELLAAVAPDLAENAADLQRYFGAQSAEQKLALAVSSAALALVGVYCSGWLAVRPTIARWKSPLPMAMLAGLVPVALAAVVVALLTDPIKIFAGLEALFKLPVAPIVPDAAQLAFVFTAGWSVLVACIAAPPENTFAVLALAGVPRTQSRTWYWLAVALNAAFLLLLVHVASISLLRATLTRSLVILWVLHDVWREWRLRTRGEVAVVARLPGSASVVATRHLLDTAQVAHAVRGLALRSLFQGLVPYTSQLLLVNKQQATRAAAELAPLSSAIRDVA